MKNVQVLPKVPSDALEVFGLLPEGTRAEVLNNILHMSCSPFLEHQQLSMKLSNLIGPWVEQKKLGILIAAPFDVYLEEQVSVVQPDLLFISNKKKIS